MKQNTCQIRLKITYLLLLVLAIGCNQSDPTKYKPTGATERSGMIPQEVYQTELPSSLPELKGSFYHAKKWQDNNGENLVVLTYGPGEGSRYENKSLHGFHYIRQSQEYTLLWKMNDFVNNCEFDLTCEFFSDATTITDLDNNGIAEVKVQYQLNCTSDIGGNGMKLLMYENGKKRALRGSRWMDMNNYTNTNFPFTKNQLSAAREGNAYSGGRYENDDEFRDAPYSFLEFAQAEWIKYVVQNIY